MFQPAITDPRMTAANTAPTNWIAVQMPDRIGWMTAHAVANAFFTHSQPTLIALVNDSQIC